MNRTLVAGLCLLAIGACDKENPYTFSGTDMYELFPFDGDVRTWEYINVDESLSYRLVAKTRIEDPVEGGSYRIYNVDYTTDCVQTDPTCVEDELIRTVGISSDVVNGVLIHTVESNGSVINYDPPLALADKEMKPGDTVVTETDGQTFTATFVGVEFCPVRLNVDWRDCAHITLEDGDADPLTNADIVGDYWAIAGQNIVAIQLSLDTDQWQLSAVACEPDDTCLGDW